LAAVAIAREAGTVDWHHPAATGLLVLLASMLASGLVGLRAGARAVRPAEELAAAGATTA
jgi:hypothetical protein